MTRFLISAAQAAAVHGFGTKNASVRQFDVVIPKTVCFFTRFHCFFGNHCLALELGLVALGVGHVGPRGTKLHEPCPHVLRVPCEILHVADRLQISLPSCRGPLEVLLDKRFAVPLQRHAEVLLVEYDCALTNKSSQTSWEAPNGFCANRRRGLDAPCGKSSRSACPRPWSSSSSPCACHGPSASAGTYVPPG